MENPKQDYWTSSVSIVQPNEWPAPSHIIYHLTRQNKITKKKKFQNKQIFVYKPPEIQPKNSPLDKCPIVEHTPFFLL